MPGNEKEQLLIFQNWLDELYVINQLFYFQEIALFLCEQQFANENTMGIIHMEIVEA